MNDLLYSQVSKGLHKVKSVDLMIRLNGMLLRNNVLYRDQDRDIL